MLKKIPNFHKVLAQSDISTFLNFIQNIFLKDFVVKIDWLKIKPSFNSKIDRTNVEEITDLYWFLSLRDVKNTCPGIKKGFVVLMKHEFVWPKPTRLRLGPFEGAGEDSLVSDVVHQTSANWIIGPFQKKERQDRPPRRAVVLWPSFWETIRLRRAVWAMSAGDLSSMLLVIWPFRN